MTVFSRLLAAFKPRKKIMVAALGACLITALFLLRDMEMAENIDSMLPDDDSIVAEDLRLLSKAPFLSSVLVVIEAGPETSRENLMLAARDIQKATGPPWFKDVSVELQQPLTGRFFEQLLEILPSLITMDDLERIDSLLTPESVYHSLEEMRLELSGLQGLGMKKIIQSDPLGLRFLAMEKFKALDFFGMDSMPNLSATGVFTGPYGKSALLILDPEAAVTDSRESEKMLEHLESILSDILPQDSSAYIISGHSYAVANAQIIRQDLVVVFSVSFLGILAVFLIFLRVWQGVLVYVIPLAAILGGTAAAVLTNSVVSGITIGFGAVLMGISVDYGLHVFFAMKRGTSPGKSLDRVSRPIMFCWLTTCGVFSLLLLSGIPGQRQLALFTVAGLTTAVFLALIVLPVFISKQTLRPERPFQPGLITHSLKRRTVAITIFFALMLGAIFCWPHIRFEGHLQALSVVPKELAKAEEKISSSWGDARGMAMIFTKGPDLDSALARAGSVYDFLVGKLPDQKIVSIAPLLPPEQKQVASIHLWNEFWDDRTAHIKEIVASKGQELGFTPDALVPFIEYLEAKPEKVTLEDLKAIGLKDLADILILRDGGEIAIVTLFPDNPEILSLLSENQDILPEAIMESMLVSQQRIGLEIASALREDMLRFLVMAGIMVTVLVLLLFRSPEQAFVALVPALAGLAAVVTGAAVLNLEFNLYSMAATFLVLGLGVDYGIFMASRSYEHEALGTRQAILASGLTTLVGFGALVLASHPALRSIGLTVLLGIAAAIPAALYVIPALNRYPDSSAKDLN